MIELKMKVKGVGSQPSQGAGARGVFLTPDYTDKSTAELLGLTMEQALKNEAACPSKFLLAEVVGEAAAMLSQGKRLKVTIEEA